MLLLVFTAAALSAGSVCNAENKPGITREDIIYSIMTDRFCDGDASNDANTSASDLKSYHGGDFQGIINKLDYIKELGFTTIWISPVVDNESFGYHGYWAYDFYKTEEHFGTVAKLKELVDAAHSKGMKVIIDLVVNHTGAQNPWASDPKYAGWFHDNGNIINWNDQSEVENGKLAGLPDFDTENPEVRRYLYDMAKWWISQTGFDGYRLDTVRHIPKPFWEEFVKEIKKDYPDFFFLGEVFSGDADYVAGYQKTGIDGITDFPMYYAINDVFGGVKPAGRLSEAIEKSSVYSDRYLMGTFIDNHDVPRFTNQLTAFKTEKLRQALAFTMTYTGIPIVYYGTEIAMKGGSDPDNRRDMDWSATSPFTDYIKKLTSIRKSNPALTGGELKISKVESDFISYYRSSGSNTVIVVFNTSNKEKQAAVPIPRETSAGHDSLVDLLDGREYAFAENELALIMAPRQVNIFTFAEENPGILPWLASGGVLLIVAAAFLVIRSRRKGQR